MLSLSPDRHVERLEGAERRAKRPQDHEQPARRRRLPPQAARQDRVSNNCIIKDLLQHCKIRDYYLIAIVHSFYMASALCIWFCDIFLYQRQILNWFAWKQTKVAPDQTSQHKQWRHMQQQLTKFALFILNCERRIYCHLPTCSRPLTLICMVAEDNKATCDFGTLLTKSVPLILETIFFSLDHASYKTYLWYLTSEVAY